MVSAEEKKKFGSGRISRTALSSMLAAFLLFNAVFPIPIGVRAVDEFRAQRADAVVPVAAVAAVQIFGTALAAYGVYVAGSTLNDYAANRQSLYDSWIGHVGITSSEADEMMFGCVDSSGNVDMSALPQKLFWATLPGFASSLVEGGSAVGSSTSEVSVSGINVELSGYRLQVAHSEPFRFLYDNKIQVPVAWSTRGGDKIIWSYVPEGSTQEYVETRYHSSLSAENLGRINLVNSNINNVNEMQFTFYRNGTYCYVPGGDGLTATVVRKAALDYCPAYVYPNTNAYYTGIKQQVADGWVVHFNSDYVFSVYRGDNSRYPSNNDLLGVIRDGAFEPTDYFNTRDGVSSGYVGVSSPTVVSSAAADGTAAVPTGSYQVFEPTADQLASGYDSTAVLKAEVAEQGATIKELQNQITTQATAIAALQSGLKEQGDNFETKTAAIASIVDRINDKVDENADEVHALKGEAATLAARVGALETQGAQDKADLATVIEITRAILAGVNPLNGDLVHDGKTVASLVSSLVNPVSAVGTAVGAISTTLDAVAENEEEFQGTLLGDIAALHKMVGQKVDSLKDTLGGKLDDVLDALGDTALGGLIRQILGLLKQVIEGDFSLANILEAIKAVPRAAADALSGILEAVFLPSPGHLQGKADGIKVALKDKLGWDYDVMFDFSEKQPGKISAPVHAGFVNIDEITMFEPKFLVDAVDKFRGILRGFVALLLLFFSYNQLMAILGGRQLFVVGKAVADSDSKG